MEKLSQKRDVTWWRDGSKLMWFLDLSCKNMLKTVVTSTCIWTFFVFVDVLLITFYFWSPPPVPSLFKRFSYFLFSTILGLAQVFAIRVVLFYLRYMFVLVCPFYCFCWHVFVICCNFLNCMFFNVMIILNKSHACADFVDVTFIFCFIRSSFIRNSNFEKLKEILTLGRLLIRNNTFYTIHCRL